MPNKTIEKEEIKFEDPIIEKEVMVVKKEKVEEKPKVFKNMDIAGTMVRVSDQVVINALPVEKNPFTIISNEEVEGRDGKKYGIEILQRHSFKVVSDQTKAPKVQHLGVIKLNRLNSVIPASGDVPRENEIEFIN